MDRALAFALLEPVERLTPIESDGRFTDIDELLRDYDDLDRDDILNHYMWMLRIIRVNGWVRPITIYVTLLENGEKIDGSVDYDRSDIILELTELCRYNLLRWTLDDGYITEYSKFLPIDGVRFDYFAKKVMVLSARRINFSRQIREFTPEEIDLFCLSRSHVHPRSLSLEPSR